MKILLCIISGLFPLLAMAETNFQCPSDYPTKLLHAKGVPDGWHGISHVPGTRIFLQSAGVIAGSPLKEFQGIQRGVETKTKTGLKVKFEGLNDFVDPLEKWVYCAYGAGGEVQLLQKIADNTRECMADYRRYEYGYRITITCR